MSDRSNILTVARREYAVRVRTRSFTVGTLLLILGVIVIAMLPVIIKQFDRTTVTKVAVATSPGELASASASTLSQMLNATPASTADADAPPAFIVSVAADLETARRDVVAGRYSAVLGIDRSAGGDLAFTLYTNEPSSGRTSGLISQAANAIAIADRLERRGLEPADQATVFAPADFSVRWPDPARTDPVRDALSSAGSDMLGFGMTILIYMIILMYGNWIAMSVVEEKASRVMEVVLNAASPFQLLVGKVFGVGAVALTQYAAVVVAGIAALAAQGLVASSVFGDTAAAMALPEGLTPAMLLAFATYGVLGFLLYASLYAGVGSLVSKQEDVNSAVMPMTLLSTAGYMVGVYAAMGLLDIKAGWIVALTQVPLLSPFMMLGRVTAGAAAPWEVALSITLLIAAITCALWLASRLYAVGVLMYGSRPGARAVLRLLRTGI